MPSLFGLRKTICAIGLILCCSSFLRSQVIVYEEFVPKRKALYENKRFFGPYIHSRGLGFIYEQGKYNRRHHYHGWSVEILTQFNRKAYELRANSMIQTSRRKFAYGRINSFFTIRAGYGSEIELTEKPFWGGVKLSFTYNGGFSLGVAIPQYLYVLYVVGVDVLNRPITETKLEKFDLENPFHLDYSRIQGGPPLFYGWRSLRPYPGIYLKVGLNFEFGKTEEKNHSLEIGAMYDFYFVPIPLMAYQKQYPGFLNIYLAYKFGMVYKKK